MTVQVTGSKEAVDQAKKVIEQILEETQAYEADTIRVSIPLLETEEIKRIIGFGGKQIQAIQADTGAWLSVEDDNMVVLIEGSQEQTEAARSQVEDILKKYRSKPTSAKENLPLNRFGRTALLIGSGKPIEHIRQFSGAQVSIRDIPKNDEEWTLTISGTPESIQKAKEIVEETIDQAKAEHEKRKAAHEKRMAEHEKRKAAKKAAHEKREAEREKRKAEQEKRKAAKKAAKKAAHQKMLAEHKAAKKAKKGSSTEKKTG